MRGLNLGQRVAVLVGVGVALAALGRWVTRLGTHRPGRWVAFAPLAHRVVSVGPVTAGGLHPWARLLIWLGLVLVWTCVAVVLLRTPTPSPAAD